MVSDDLTIASVRGLLSFSFFFKFVHRCRHYKNQAVNLFWILDQSLSICPRTPENMKELAMESLKGAFLDQYSLTFECYFEVKLLQNIMRFNQEHSLTKI